MNPLDRSQARGSYRDDDRRRYDVTASGKSRAAAQRALQGKVNNARTEHRGGDTVLRHDSKLEQAAAVWLDWRMREGKSANTMRDYSSYVRTSINASTFRELTIVHVNDVARIEAWLSNITNRLRTHADLHGAAGPVFGTTYFATKAGRPRDINVTAKYLGRTTAPTRAAAVMVLPPSTASTRLRVV